MRSQRRTRASLPEQTSTNRRQKRFSSPKMSSPRFHQQLLTRFLDRGRQSTQKQKVDSEVSSPSSSRSRTFSPQVIMLNSSGSVEKENPAARLRRSFREMASNNTSKSSPRSPSPKRAPPISPTSLHSASTTPTFSSPNSSTNNSFLTPKTKTKRIRGNLATTRARRSNVTSRSRAPETSTSTAEISAAHAATRKRGRTVHKEDANSPIKTRLLQKSADVPRSACALCNRPNNLMLECTNCQLKYHPIKCLLYSRDVAESLMQRNDWLCPQCITCVKCAAYIDDPGNLECCKCGRVWHGACRPVDSTYSSDWMCRACAGHASPSHRVISSAKTYHRGPLPTPQSTPTSRMSLLAASGIVNKEKLGDSKKRENNLTRALSPNHFSTMLEELNHEDLMPGPSNKKNAKTSKDRGLIETKSPTKVLRQLEAILKERDNSPLKSMKKDTIETYNEVLRNYKRISLPKKAGNDTTQWVHMATRDKMKVIYQSTAYSDEIQKAPNIYVCIYCLMAMADVADYRIHADYCEVYHPPGNEIYRDGNVSFFEVDGQFEQGYCRRLCKLAKLFLSSKKLYHDVQDFWFYILTETTEHGCEIVGYFSKEKKPSKDYNLSCLLALPYAQKKGYGRFIIDMSYEISRIERRIGGPEHPLSDLGLKTYIGYWRASILAYLRSLQSGITQISLADMSLATRIKVDEIVAQLLRDRLIVHQDGQYYVRHGERALRFPLCASRRRTVRKELLVWEPEEDINDIDPTKINGYSVREN
ncbi:unnamed protein product, partial [Mesorhabditis belari]|uniref:Histone acetyltransferase n=1 Tax=Mesorhabditis belari TaxID=2138241 RepID=A0AAF3EJA5_9BILA